MLKAELAALTESEVESEADSEAEMNWADAIEEKTSTKKTPINAIKKGQKAATGIKTRSKRLRSTQDQDTPEGDNLAKKPNLDLESFRSILVDSVKRMEAMVGQVSSKSDENTKEIEALKINTENKFIKLDLTLARLKEDTDTFDNDRMRDTILLKKLKSEKELPKSHQDILQVAKNEVKDMIKAIMPEYHDQMIRYIGLLHQFDGKFKRQSEFELPPIKIQFKRKEDCLDFRYKAMEHSKKFNARYSGVYLVHPQNPATRVRVMVMWAIAKSLKDEKQKVDAWVSQSGPKPTLIIKKGDGNKNQKVMSFVQAVSTHGESVNPQDLVQASTVANRFFKGEVSKFFVILKDDSE
jgi:hypothetical protein